MTSIIQQHNLQFASDMSHILTTVGGPVQVLGTTKSNSNLFTFKLLCHSNNNNTCDLYHTIWWCKRMEIMTPHTENLDSSLGQGKFNYIYWWVLLYPRMKYMK